jgi:hypothetical protein
MASPRKSEEVVQQLLAAMRLIVTNYHPTVKQTGLTLSRLIPGTAFFPGGSGSLLDVHTPFDPTL